MNELQVSAQPQPGVINWNFEDIKARCKQEMETYKKLVFTDADIKTAKSKLTELRKYRTQVETVRKSVKAEYMKPYDAFEKQSKELVSIIDEPIDFIGKQVTEYEMSRKKQQREAILRYMDERFAPFPKALVIRLKQSIYDSRWENLTAKKSDWQPVIDAKAAAVLRDMQVLGGIEEEFKSEAEKVYFNSLALSDALARVEELRRMKARVLEAERRRAAEKEESKRRQAEADAALQEQRSRMDSAVPEAAPAVPQPKATVEHLHEAQKMVKEPVKIENPTPSGKNFRTVKLYGSNEQVMRILAYAKYIGVSYEFVEADNK